MKFVQVWGAAVVMALTVGAMSDASAQSKRPGGGGGTTSCSPVAPRPAGKASLVRNGVAVEYTTLEAALLNARGGDRIILQAGYDYVPISQSFTLPYRSETEWITIESDAAGTLPAGSRVGPANQAAMPRLLTMCDAHPVIVTEHVGAGQASHHYHFIGVEITTLSSTYVSHLVRLASEVGAETESSVADLPHSFVFERSYIHGKADIGTRRGIALNAGNGRVVRGGTGQWPDRIDWAQTTGGVKIIDSYFSDFKHASYDTQAILGWNGKGPFLIQNNYLEGAGENVMFGGQDPKIQYLVPGDIEIRGNDFFKPTAWNKWVNGGSDPWAVKNLFELKNAERVLIEKNVFENHWVDDQNGFAILLTPRNQNGTAPWSVVRDVRIERNVVKNVSAGINMLGEDDTRGRTSEYATNIVVRYNLFQMVPHTQWGGTSNNNAGRFMQVQKGVRSLTVDHNTSFHTRAISFSLGEANPGFTFTNNVMQHNDYAVLGNNSGISGDGTNPGAGTLDRYFFSAGTESNVLFNVGSGVWNYYGWNDLLVGSPTFSSDDVLTAPHPTWLTASATPGTAEWPGIDAAVTADVAGVVQQRPR